MDSLEQISQKKNLRKMIKEKLTAVTNVDKIQQSKKACSSFLSSELYKNASIIFSYMAMDAEISPLEITNKALRDGKLVALPKIIPHTSDMSFYFLDSTQTLESQLVAGMWNILEPVADENKVVTVSSVCGNKSVMIVPGVAFTNVGERLGHGRGYYDKYIAWLETENAASHCSLDFMSFVGMCLEEQIVSYLPTESFDKKMDYLLTANTFSFCN